ncbi:MAG TPA: M56 family metallopeptidase, partial [Thermoanaerobaculia bacterium]|nr:M56 family metallopeptidase [Thermoanaerobaculia bacterium]
MNAESWLTGPLAQAIGWALVHLVWQGAVIAALLAATLMLMQRRTASARYVVSCAALAFLLACGVATAWRSYDAGHETAALGSSEASPIVATSEAPAAAIPGNQASIADPPLAAIPWRIMLLARMPQIVLFWLLGVTVLSLRLVSSWTRALRLTRAHAAAGLANEWQGAVLRLAAALRLRRAVRLMQSAAVEVPTVVGWLRPLILLPVSALAGLSSEQLEMVLAHELAHIRRHDFLVNLMQAFVETLLFYHPAVWWMSRRVRVERENCCDDLAVAVCGDPLRYARALTRLEELRPSTSRLALAASGGSLLGRI